MTVIVRNIPANFAACKVWVWVILHTPGMVSGKISWSCGFQMSVLSSLRTQKNLNFPPLSFDWRRALSDEYLQTSADKTKAVCTDTYLKEKVEKYAFWYLGWTLFILKGWYKKDTVCCSASFLPHSPPQPVTADGGRRPPVFFSLFFVCFLQHYTFQSFLAIYLYFFIVLPCFPNFSQ